ncbi:hypothetical protein P3T35_003025 [Kitasatospora sp. GP30]|uniref:hypothetical protein n=1 Tax=Kitasatospora sp. GP30 TaxID=3035084 RepID=UPI000C70773C|nr:hypothetical protein [Kitasatospora sp. GP30]MDH6141012.1 hypothetical protein [Kitasatospora sp. GP30]
MTNQRHPAESPQPPLRRPGRARTNTGTTLAQPGAQSLRQAETTVSTPQSRPSGTAATIPAGQWPIPRSRAARTARLAETHPGANETRARFHVVLGSLKAMLEDEPSERAARSAGRRICAAVAQLTDEVAISKREAA